jgi:hypothetical protein
LTGVLQERARTFHFQSERRRELAIVIADIGHGSTRPYLRADETAEPAFGRGPI